MILNISSHFKIYLAMFNKNDSKKVMEEMVKSSTIIGKGTILEGNIETIGHIGIDGKLVGNLKTKSKVNIGETALLEGNILAQNAEIAGHVKGIIEVADLLTVKASAIIDGDIIAGKINIDPGAVFNGTCKMGAVVKEISIQGFEKHDAAPEPKQKEKSA